jgi:hypothetical protein
MKSMGSRTQTIILCVICSGLAAVVGGCSLAPGSEQADSAAHLLIATGVADRQHYNDKKAETLLTLPCDISLGAYYRLSNGVQQEALMMLCSGRRPYESAPSLISSVSR